MPLDVWHRLLPVLLGQPAHAQDALDDLRSLTHCWEPDRRTWLVLRVAARGRIGTPLPAALMLALCEVLDD